MLFGSRTLEAFRVARAEPAANITEGDPARSFQIDWKALFRAVRASREGPEVLLGFYHSHPDGSARPSSLDNQGAWCDHLFVIVPVTPSAAAAAPRAWWKPANGDEFVPLRILAGPA